MKGIHMGEVSKVGLGLDLAAWYVEAGTATFGIPCSHHLQGE
jgi:hypothetical protein